MILSTNKDKGRAGLLCGMSYYGTNGYTILLPVNDTQDYDFVIEKDNVFRKVQCKCTNYRPSDKESYQLSLRNFGGTDGGVYGRVVESSADILFALAGDGTMYSIPVDDLGNRNSISLRKESNLFENKNIFHSEDYIVTLK